MSHEVTETLVEPLTRLGLTVERAGPSLRVAADLERVMTLTPSKDGLVLCHQLDPEAGDPELWGRLNRLNRQSAFARFVARETGVWVETYLPFGGRSLASNQLHVACGELDGAIQRYHAGAGNADVAATALLHAPPAQQVDRSAPTVMQPAAERPGDPTVAMPKGETLPASFLAGKGQLRPSDRTTSRYGALNSVPGRGVASRPPMRSSRGGDRLVLLVLLGLALLVGGGTVGAYVALDRGWLGSSEDSTADTPDAPSDPAPDATPTADDPSTDPDPTEVPDDPPVDAGWPTHGGPDPQPDTSSRLPESLPEILTWIREHPDRIGQGTRAALRSPEFRQPGSWIALVEALGKKLNDREVVGVLAARVRDVPPSIRDSLDCLPRAQGSFRYALIGRVVECDPDERDLVARALHTERARDTPDLAIEQGLVRLRRPAPDSLQRLVHRKGDDWIVFGPGRALLEGLAQDAVGELKPLQNSPSPRVRATVAELCAASGDARGALKVLTPLLRDELSDVRGVAIESMVKLNSPLASWPLARRLTTETDGALKSQLRTALRNLSGRQTVKLLTQLYARPATRDRRAALLGLEATGSSDAIATIVTALNDRANELQLLALRQLARIQRQPGLRGHVRKGTSRIREMAQEHRDPEVARAARDLFVQLTGSAPR